MPFIEKNSFYLFFFNIFIVGIFFHTDCYSQINKPTKTRLQLNHFHQFQFAGYYAALEKGFYANEGLDVELIEGGKINSVEKVINDDAEYGIGNNNILLDFINDKPIQLLSSIFQTSSSIFISLEESKITTIHDLIDKKILFSNNYLSPELLAILHKEGINFNHIKPVFGDNSLKKLINKEVDVIHAQQTNEPFILDQNNVKYRSIIPKTYGIHFYGDGIFTSKKEIKNNPKRVQAFIKASKKGWEYALKNQDEIINLILTKYNSQKNYKQLKNEAEQVSKLILNQYIDIGQINKGRLSNIANLFFEVGVVNSKIDINNFIYEPEKTHIPYWLKIVLITIGIIIMSITFYSLYLFLFNKYLKNTIDKKTASLQLKNKELKIEIEKHKKTERALKKSEQNFKQLLNNLPSGSIHIVNQNKLFTNKKVEEITGYTNKEIPNIATWFQLLYQQNLNDNLKKYNQSKKTGFKTPTYTKIHCKDGNIKDVEFLAYSFNNNEIWLMNDITNRIRTEQALIKSENKLRKYVESSPNGLIIFNKKAKIIYANKAFGKMINLPERYKNKISLTQITPFSELKKSKSRFSKLIKQGQIEIESIIKSLTGQKIEILSNTVQLNENEFLSFVIDISKIKNTERKLQSALKKAEESDRLKSAFLANMSHEIRTPMNGILGFSRLILENNISAIKRAQYADIIHENGKQLLAIINNIIDISYLEVKQLKIFDTEFSISKFISDLDQFFSLEKERYEKQNLTLEFKYLNSYDYNLTADVGKIKQVIINLINNAIKFTNEGSISIQAELQQTNLYFTVNDTGIGIPKSKQEIIFKRFGQVENIHSKKFGGIGLGLPISKGLVELLGGEMWVNSEEGKGSKFTFFIPVKLLS